MRNHILIHFFVLLGAMGMLSSCSDDTEKTIPDQVFDNDRREEQAKAEIISPDAELASDRLPEPEAEALKRYIQEQNSYLGWPLFPGMAKFYPGNHPYGALLTTYTNQAAHAVAGNTGEKGAIYPYGSILVKENYDQEKNLEAVTVMYRVENYNPVSGDWFWLKYDAEGTVMQAGKVNDCISCHANAEPYDWVFTGHEDR